MKFFLLILFSTISLNGQNGKYIYSYEFIFDKNTPNQLSRELMILDIKNKSSKFYSYEKFKSDSTRQVFAKHHLFFMPEDKNYINFMISKNIKDGDVKNFTAIYPNFYNVVENLHFQWKITNKRDVILTHEVISASVNFGGRDWTAWFSPDIPIQDGPYKFFGLPGLIMKMEDSSKTHSFTLIGIENLKNISEYPITNENSSPLQITRLQYGKIFKEYRNDPLKSFRGRYPDQTDSEGNFRTGAQVFRESEKIFKKNIAKDNNIIELDLLK